MWDTFFSRIEKEIAMGKEFNFQCAKGWTIGGEGTDIIKLQKWNRIMDKCNGHHMFSGYGSSELFSAIAVKKYEIPTYIEFIKDMPRKNGTEKVDYELLEKDAIKKHSK